ncbi:NAD(P)-binding domain superfamily protein [Abortiporus biennis]
MTSYLVTGASRGIGLGLVQSLVKDPENLVAQEVDQLLPNGLDYLVNNAGISRQLLVTYDDFNYDHLTEELRLNTVCMIKLLGAFKPIISRSTEKKIVTMSSLLASIELSVTCPLIGRSYGIAKAALNMTTRKWIIGNRDSGITGVLIHPGVVRTDMGTPLAEFFKAIGYNGDVLTVDESVHYIRKIVDDPSRFSESVRFCSYKGPDLPF